MILNDSFFALGLVVLCLKHSTLAKEHETYEIENGREALKSIFREIENFGLKMLDENKWLWTLHLLKPFQNDIQVVAEFSSIGWTQPETETVSFTFNANFDLILKGKGNRGMTVFYIETPITKKEVTLNENENNRTWMLLLLCLLNFSPIIYRVKLRRKIPFIFAFIMLFLDVSNGAPQPYARETGELCNNGRGKIIALGVQTSSFWSTSYTVQIIVCFDPVTRKTFWTKHFLGHTTPGLPRPPPIWSQDYLGLNLEPTYRSLNSTLRADRGHLAPNADFDGNVERRATNYYINSAPQSRTLNRGQWAQMEDRVRSLANSQTDRVLVITGSAGNRFTFYRCSARRIEYPYPNEFFKIVVLSDGRIQIYVGNNDNSNPCVANITQLSSQLRERWGLEISDTNYQEARRQFDRVYQDVVGHDEHRKK